MKKNIYFLLGAVFSSAGILALIISAIFFFSTRTFISNASTSQGTVVEMEYSKEGKYHSYFPIIKFGALDGNEYQFRSEVGNNPPRWRKGDWVEIIYSRENPYKAKINSFPELWLSCLIPLIIGSVFLIIGFSFLIIRARRVALISRLKTNGVSVLGTVIEVRSNTSVRINRRSPFVIDCQWTNPLTGKVQISTSDNIWHNPLYSKQIKIGSEIRVYFDQSNPKRVYVDIGEILKA